MKAIRVENPGSGYQLVVGDIPRPAAGASDVLIKVAGAGLNRADNRWDNTRRRRAHPKRWAWKCREKLWMSDRP